MNINTGAVVPNFSNDLSGGIGTNGTARRPAPGDLARPDQAARGAHRPSRSPGQDRYGAALINTTTNQLLPWSTNLWKDNLQYVGGIQRAYGGAISPDGSYFVVTSGSGGDRPPINDTAMAFPMDGGADPSNVQPLWITRCFDSIYSVAISEKAVYIGGHFAWNESPTAPDPWPGLDNVGYGTGQGLVGLRPGRRRGPPRPPRCARPGHRPRARVEPRLELRSRATRPWRSPRAVCSPAATPRSRASGNVGRVAFFDLSQLPAQRGHRHHHHRPDRGSRRAGRRAVHHHRPRQGRERRCQPRPDPDQGHRTASQYLQDDLTTLGRRQHHQRDPGQPRTRPAPTSR